MRHLIIFATTLINCYFTYAILTEEKMLKISEHAENFCHLSLSSRIPFTNSIKESKFPDTSEQATIDKIIKPGTSAEKDMLMREYETFHYYYSEHAYIYNDEELRYFNSVVEECEKTFLGLLRYAAQIDADIYWPTYVFNPNDNSLYVRGYNIPGNLDSSNSESDDEGFITGPLNSNMRHSAVLKGRKEYRYKGVYENTISKDLNGQKISDIPYEDQYESDTPQAIVNRIKNTNDKLSLGRHHIIPLKRVSWFFNVVHRMLKHNYECEASLAETRFNRARNGAELRDIIGLMITRQIDLSEVLKNDINEKISKSNSASIFWHPGNIVFGPRKRSDDPKDFKNDASITLRDGFEVKFQYIIGRENWDLMNHLDERIMLFNRKLESHISLSDEQLYSFITENDLCEEMNKIYNDFFTITHKVNNGKRGLFGIKWNNKQWKSKINPHDNNEEWEVIPSFDYMNKNQFTTSSEKPKDLAEISGGLSTVVGLSALLCSKANIRKRSVNDQVKPQLQKLATYLVIKNADMLVKEHKNIDLHTYVLNQLRKSNYTGVIKSKIEEMCSELKETKPIYDYGAFESCYKTSVVSSTAVGSVAGCAAGAAAGTFVFPVLGTVAGCVTGMLGVGATSMLASKAIAKSVC